MPEVPHKKVCLNISGTSASSKTTVLGATSLVSASCMEMCPVVTRVLLSQLVSTWVADPDLDTWRRSAAVQTCERDLVRLTYRLEVTTMWKAAWTR